jgi:light-regulated signal transduction histidine kinase (bacteriophytochrome)
MLQEDYAALLDDEGKRLLQVIQDNSRKMAELIDDLLAFSKLGRQPIKAAEVDMTALAEEAFEELRANINHVPARIVMVQLPPARGDRALLRQVWVNLLSNALKYSGTRERALIEVTGQLNGTQTMYTVKDNGVGFDMQYYAKLFGVFQRLHSAEEFPGTGVGLAIVQRVVTRHGGRVWAEGKLNEGATFHFSLPKEATSG